LLTLIAGSAADCARELQDVIVAHCAVINERQ
jgi:hypothetical protein